MSILRICPSAGSALLQQGDVQGTTRHDHSGSGSHALGYNEPVTDLGKVFILVGAAIVVIGVVLALAGRSHLPLGRLPGDIVYRGKNTTFYFPLATSILISLVLSVLLYVIGRFKH